ncbi:APC family permease [Occallatibacter savannae]|uniref:APC family permease n=1 Tax=Occallatibacter savannae TaxID=1002691 RepID=UPI001EF59F56|nr:APC family permease [Occallatibacter savannae]
MAMACEDAGTMGEDESASKAEHQLRRQLGLRDLVFSQVLCVVGTMWVGVAAGLGKAQTLMWLGAMVAFYLPMAGSVIALNRAMPLEGGLYIWAQKAFGNLGGFLTAWNLWFYGIAVTASILYGIPSEVAYLVGPRGAWLPENRVVSIAIVTVLIVLLTAAEIRGLEIGKWIHNAGAVAIMAVFVALIGLGPWAVVRHVPVHWTPLSFEMPPHDLRTLAMFGQMMFGALCGLEYIAILAGESKSPEKTITKSVWIASPIICLMFILGTGTVVAFVPRDQINFIAPIPQTLRIALGNEGAGNLFAMTAILLLEMRLLGAVSYLMTGVSRLPLAVGWNEMIPAWFTRLHERWKTPVNSILCTSGLLVVMVVLATAGVHAQEAFQVLSNASLTHYEVAYLAMFAIPLVGAAGLRKTLPRWLKWTSVVGLGATLFSLMISAYPFVSVANPLSYAVKIVGTLLVSNLVAVTFYKMRTRTVRSDVLERDAEFEAGAD